MERKIRASASDYRECGMAFLYGILSVVTFGLVSSYIRMTNDTTMPKVEGSGKLMDGASGMLRDFRLVYEDMAEAYKNVCSH